MDDVATLGGDDDAQQLSDLGFVAAYNQSFRLADPTQALSGGPARIGVLTILFDDPASASDWNNEEVQNPSTVAKIFAAADGSSVTVIDALAIRLPALGDESSAAEVRVTALVQGFTATVYLDIAFIRRESVQFTVVVAGLQSQQSALASTARTLDGRIAAALN